MYSEKVLQRMKKPLFREDLKERELFLNDNIPGSFSFEIDSSSHHGQILIFGILDKNQMPSVFAGIKYSSNITDEKLSFLDALIELLNGQDITRLKSISIREVESFLRNDNITPSYEEGYNSLIPIFDKVVKGLTNIEEPQSKEKRSPNINDDYRPGDSPTISQAKFLELNTNEKKNIIDDIIFKFIAKPLGLDGGGVTPVFVDDSMVAIEYLGACINCNYSLTSTLSFIQKVIQLETENPNLLVVTDS
ncbi:MAG: hypothetical protein DRQ88_02310 [Epsilonproteobacteria bacterium]|nr:MAG: hypothetical protein DRQ89_01055 [Campylobacterota bacterium]RLA67693.1 MAG: hypothetical protein DRQ88_02310 [Campylobacterota bacterium]